jgi:hypothetical protein
MRSSDFGGQGLGDVAAPATVARFAFLRTPLSRERARVNQPTPFDCILVSPIGNPETSPIPGPDQRLKTVRWLLDCGGEAG